MPEYFPVDYQEILEIWNQISGIWNLNCSKSEMRAQVRQQSGAWRVGAVAAYEAQRDAFRVKYEDSPDEQWEREALF